eukprot:scaffold2857_cov121-Isochrysis_galbana.AAC.13
MENNNLALSKRARSTPAPNETVCISIADAHAPHTLPCTIDDKNCLHTPVNQLPEPTTLRRLTISSTAPSPHEKEDSPPNAAPYAACVG